MNQLFVEGEKGNLLTPSSFESIITGVARAFYSYPRFNILYTDGTTEEAVCPELEEHPSIFKIVPAIQSRRTKHAA